MSDPRTSPSSSSTSPTRRPAARSRCAPPRDALVAGLGVAAIVVAGLGAPVQAADRPGHEDGGCKPMALRAALGSPRPGDLYLRPGTAGCDQAEVEVAADAVAGVFTVSFDLSYPPSLVKYAGYTVGPLLRRAPVATPPLCLVQESLPGTLQVTMTRFAPDHGVTADGSEALLVVRFDRVAPGTGAIDFDLGPASRVAESVVDDHGTAAAARFGPGHGLRLIISPP